MRYVQIPGHRGSITMMTGARFPTEAAAEASAPTAASYVDVIDAIDAGDEASGVFHKTGNDGVDVPAHDHYLTVGGKNFAYLSRTIRLNTVGKVVHTEILARLQELNEKGGGELQIRDTHLITGSVGGGADQTATMIFNFGSTGEIVTGPGTNPFVFNLNAPHGVGDVPKDIVFVNPRIDVSAGTGGTGNSGTALGFDNFRKVTILGGRLFAGAVLGADHGDSGIAAVNIAEMLVEGTSIRGFKDNGIYISGGSLLSDEDDGWTTKIVNNSIAYCGNAINSKRQYHNILAQGNAIRYCGRGICSEGADTTQQPGWRYQIIGNFIEKTNHRPINLMGPTKAIIANNHIKDWGYSADGLTMTTSSPFGLFLDGVTKALVQGNRIEMLDWVPAAGVGGLLHIGVRINDDPDIFGTAYVSGQCSFSNNRWRSLDIGIDDDSATHGSSFINEHFALVDEISHLHNDSHLTYTTEEAPGITTVCNYPNEFTNGVRSYSATLTNGQATSFQLPVGVVTYLLTLGCDDTGAGKPNGQIWARMTTPALVDVNLNTTSLITLTTGVLTPPTAPDTHTILSITNTGLFYIENRTGATRKYSLLVQPIGAA